MLRLKEENQGKKDEELLSGFFNLSKKITDLNCRICEIDPLKYVYSVTIKKIIYK